MDPLSASTGHRSDRRPGVVEPRRPRAAGGAILRVRATLGLGSAALEPILRHGLRVGGELREVRGQLVEVLHHHGEQPHRGGRDYVRCPDAVIENADFAEGAARPSDVTSSPSMVTTAVPSRTTNR